jgi:hypothetical protein
MARSRTLAVPRPVAVTNDKGEKSIAGEFYEARVPTSPSPNTTDTHSASLVLFSKLTARPHERLRPSHTPLSSVVQKHVTSGNKWGFPVEKPKPKYQPPPAKPEAPYVPAPWWKPLCDWRWLLAVRTTHCV